MRINPERLKQGRERLQWSQSELAIAAALSIRTVQRAENDGKVSLQTLKALAAAIDTSQDQLLLDPDTAPSTRLLELIPSFSTRAAIITTVSASLFAAIFIFGIALIWPSIGNEAAEAKTEISDNADGESKNSVADKVRGYWQGNIGSGRIALHIDATHITMRGERNLTLRHNLRGNSIVIFYNGQIETWNFRFNKEGNLIVTDMVTRGSEIVFSRTDKMVYPTVEEIEADRNLGLLLQGTWSNPAGDILDIGDEFSIQLNDGFNLKSFYLLFGDNIRVNNEGKILNFRVSIHTNDQIVLAWPDNDSNLSNDRKTTFYRKQDSKLK